MSTPSPAPLHTVDAVKPNDLQRQLQIDLTLRLLIMLGIPVVSIVLMAWFNLSHDPLGFGIMIMAGMWMLLNFISARAWSQVSNMAELFTISPDLAEARIATVLRYRPLARQVRLLSWHRLATLRHQQQDYQQTIAICQSVLANAMPNLPAIEQHLLLMLTEAQLACNDVHGAYMSLSELSRRPLSLTHSLQKLALQTRYMLEAGYNEQALDDLHNKVQMAELMPALQCGAMHVLLNIAAHRSGHADQAHWLDERARLLLSDDQYQSVMQSLAIPTVTPGELL